MAVPQNRAEFKEFCLRKLGKPVIEINVSDSQVDDRVDEALEWFWDYHFNGTQKVFYKHKIDANTTATQSIQLPESIRDVVSIFDIGSMMTASGELFNINYEIAINTLYELQNASLVNYYVTRMQYSLIQELLVGRQPIRFNRHQDRLYIDIDKNKLRTDKWIIIEAYQAMDPRDTTYTVSSTIVANSANVAGTFSNTITGGMYVTGTGIASNTYTTSANTIQVVLSNPATSSGTVSLSFEAPSDIWSDNWLQRYCTTLIKQNWGSNLSKFEGLQLPSGITFNGTKIYDEATAELQDMRDKVINSYSLPVTDFIG